MRESRLLHALEDPVDAERERQADAGELVLHDERVDPGLESPLRGFEEEVSPRERVAVHRDAIEHDLFPRYGEKTEPLLAGAPREVTSERIAHDARLIEHPAEVRKTLGHLFLARHGNPRAVGQDERHVLAEDLDGLVARRGEASLEHYPPAVEVKLRVLVAHDDLKLSLIHISEPTRLGMISYA